MAGMKLKEGRGVSRPVRGWMATASRLALGAANPAMAQDDVVASPAAAQDEAAGDAAQPAAAADEFRFDVMEYVVRGNSVLTAADIQTVLMPHAGYGKSVPDVEVARGELEKAYRDRG